MTLHNENRRVHLVASMPSWKTTSVLMLTRLASFSKNSFDSLLEEALQADSLDGFAQAVRILLSSAMPLHSVCISFNDLNSFNPRLLRDSQPKKHEGAALADRYLLLNATPIYLKVRPGAEKSSFQEQWEFLEPCLRDQYYSRYMQSEGWDKYAEIYCWSDRQLDASICVRRSKDQPNFSRSEWKFLCDFRALIAICVRRLHRLSRERATNNALREIVLRSPVPLILIDWSMQPVCFNYEARRVCSDWADSTGGARIMKKSILPEIPKRIASACRELQSSSCWTTQGRERFDSGFMTVRHEARADLSAQIEVIDVGRESAWPYFLVRLYERDAQTSENEMASTESRRMTLLSCLSACERDVALRVFDGLPNRDIARQLCKSESTVKMQLHSIFRKLQVTNRTQLATLLR